MAVSLTHAAARSPFGPASSLLACGLSEAQATAVVEIVQTTVSAEVASLRIELARWQMYLALALMMQIGLVLVAALLTRALWYLCPGS